MGTLVIEVGRLEVEHLSDGIYSVREPGIGIRGTFYSLQGALAAARAWTRAA